MSRQILISGLIVLGLFCGQPVALADEQPFPGQGNIADWNKANVEYNIAHGFKSKGQWGNAIDHFRYAISAYPYDSRYFASRASCFRKIGEPRSAISDIGKALKLKNDGVYWMMAADTYADIGDFGSCRKAVNSAAALNDSNAKEIMDAMIPKYKRMCQGSSLAWPETTDKLTLADLGVDTTPQYVPDRWRNTNMAPKDAQGNRPALRWGNSNEKGGVGNPMGAGNSSAVPTDLGGITVPKSTHKFPSPWASTPASGNKDKK